MELLLLGIYTTHTRTFFYRYRDKARRTSFSRNPPKKTTATPPKRVSPKPRLRSFLLPRNPHSLSRTPTPYDFPPRPTFPLVTCSLFDTTSSGVHLKKSPTNPFSSPKLPLRLGSRFYNRYRRSGALGYRYPLFVNRGKPKLFKSFEVASPSVHIALALDGSAGTKRKRTGEMKYYAVRSGFNPGIYTSWKDCLGQITGFKGAKCM